jgi:hypothetical protein
VKPSPPQERETCEGWLIVVAKREAWRLERQRFDPERHDPRPFGELSIASDAAPTVAEAERRDDINAAVGVLKELRPRLRRVATLRAFGYSRQDIAEVTGDSPTRVGHLVAQASEQVDELLAAERRQRQPASPRADRLWELEHDTPDWLVEALGPQARADRKLGGAQELRRSWRRAAIALDDYRSSVGPDGFERLNEADPDSSPVDTLRAKARHALEEHRSLVGGHSRER